MDWTALLLIMAGAMIATEGAIRTSKALVRTPPLAWVSFAMFVCAGLVCALIGIVLDNGEGWELGAVMVGWLGRGVLFPVLWPRVKAVLGKVGPTTMALVLVLISSLAGCGEEETGLTCKEYRNFFIEDVEFYFPQGMENWMEGAAEDGYGKLVVWMNCVYNCADQAPHKPNWCINKCDDKHPGPCQ